MRFSAKDEWSRRSLPNRIALGIGALLAIHLLALNLPALGQQNATEDQVKAAYLLNFAKLAEWSHQALPDGPSPLVIGVSGGEEDFLKLLNATVAGKTVGTHVLIVKPVSSDQDMKSCQIVFFRGSEGKHAQGVIEGVAKAGVLFVGEHESFLRQGGMINLFLDRGSVRFEVNSDALDRAQIHFSSKILALAKAGTGSRPATDSGSPSTGREPRRLNHSELPEYPELAARMKLAGTAQVQVLVKPDGTVKEVRILGGHPLLADALARAVKQWKYQPAAKETVEVVKYTFAP
jgi:TonB family protein